MVKWEYLVKRIGFNSLLLEETLNKYGKDGWEFIGFVDRFGGDKLFIFKRPKQ